MLIEEIMIRNVITLPSKATIEDAINLINHHTINHIPIINEQDQLIGIISDRDLRDASPSIFHLEEHLEDLKKPISSIMTKEVICAHPLDFVEEISSVFFEHKIGCIPIIENGNLVGIVTKTDILYTLIELTGANQPSSQIEIQVENVTGKLADIASIIRKRKTNIISVLVYPSKIEGFKVLVFRVQTMNPRNIIEDIKKEGYRVLWPNLPGVEE
jgi:acetoin utilization protein AcuB